MKIKYATICEKGKRTNNEDKVKVIDMQDKNRWTAIVCDGLGGHSLGDVASEIAINTISKYWVRNINVTDSKEKVVKACEEVSVSIDIKSSDLNHCEMGTTMAMISIENDIATIAHIGDSRCYLIRKGHCNNGGNLINSEKDNIVYQTEDHHRPNCDILSRCFFSYKPEAAVPDVVQFKVKPDDRILVCTDGLYNSVWPHVIIGRMMDDKSAETILDTFAFLCEKFSNDNYSGIMAIVEEV
ncbi:MAG: serine/threonine-protein phosphatase [Bacteroidales bacterium]|nr:serine/threonine-protein phosphatase [Candidatus Liminaster caballi]